VQHGFSVFVLTNPETDSSAVKSLEGSKCSQRSTEEIECILIYT
jgi:hypothetical protein